MNVTEDLRYAVRQMRKSPGFALTALLTLALGIGANTAIFTVFHQVLLRRLPVRDARSLVMLNEKSMSETGSFSSFGGDMARYFAYPAYERLRDQTHTLSGLAAVSPADTTLVTSTQAREVNLELVSGNYFDVLGITPYLGRTLLPSDDVKHAGNHVAVLSYDYWQGRLGGDPSILNTQVKIAGKPFTVVGVVRYRGLFDEFLPAAYVPLALSSAILEERQDRNEEDLNRWLNLVGRLKPGVTASQASAELNTIWFNWRRDIGLKHKEAIEDKAAWLRTRLWVVPGARGTATLDDDIGKPLRALQGMAAVVLLIACANVGNLLLVRAAQRQSELALRGALGASRQRLFSQVLMEGLLLGVGGSLAGLAIAYFSLHGVMRMVPESHPLHNAITTQVDWAVLAFCIGAGILTSLFFSLVPALLSSRVHLMEAMRRQASAVAGGGSLLRNALVGGEVALSLALLVAAAMFSWTLYRLQQVSPGFDRSHLLTFSVNASTLGKSNEEIRQEYKEIAEGIHRLPGVSSTVYSMVGLLSDSEWSSNMTVAGIAPKKGEPDPDYNSITPGYLSTLRIPLLAGREISESDVEGGQNVAIVDKKFVDLYFEGRQQAALGRNFGFGGGDKVKYDYTIVGVVPMLYTRDVHALSPKPYIYMAYDQSFAAKGSDTPHPATFYVRSIGDPAVLAQSVQAAVHQIDPNLPVIGLASVKQFIDTTIFGERLMAWLSEIMGALALGLAAVGLYGVLAFAVAQRTREIGVRMALGADRASISGLMLRQTLRVVAAGGVAGVLLAWLGVRLLRSHVERLEMSPPWLTAGAAILLLAVMLLASYLPAYRASHVEPMEALRSE